jgi:copper chaperone NosL
MTVTSVQVANARCGVAALIALVLVLGGCGEGDRYSVTQGPQPIQRGDECHLCGMIITDFPGPKGEVVTRRAQTLKFCSTRDLFAYLLQPEAAAVVKEVYVHDMAGTDWDDPADSAWVDARSAWYVAGHPLQGAMGPTLAAFARRVDAEAFARRHGGRVLSFGEITLDVISDLDYGS